MLKLSLSVQIWEMGHVDLASGHKNESYHMVYPVSYLVVGVSDRWLMSDLKCNSHEKRVRFTKDEKRK
jgi:hypothetical protein